VPKQLCNRTQNHLGLHQSTSKSVAGAMAGMLLNLSFF
jgi:hypothetical protein